MYLLTHLQKNGFCWANNINVYGSTLYLYDGNCKAFKSWTTSGTFIKEVDIFDYYTEFSFALGVFTLVEDTKFLFAYQTFGEGVDDPDLGEIHLLELD